MTVEERNVWQAVFKNPDGEAILMVMLNRLGYFSADRSIINPDLIAFANWMLAQIGVLTVPNLPRFVVAMVETANNKDMEPTGGEHESVL